MSLLEGGRYVENRLQFRQLAVLCSGADLVMANLIIFEFWIFESCKMEEAWGHFTDTNFSHFFITLKTNPQQVDTGKVKAALPADEFIPVIWADAPTKNNPAPAPLRNRLELDQAPDDHMNQGWSDFIAAMTYVKHALRKRVSMLLILIYSTATGHKLPRSSRSLVYIQARIQMKGAGTPRKICKFCK